MWPWIDITRPVNCLMSALSVAIGAFLVTGAPTPEMLIAALAVILITGAGNTVNDVIDVESDRINRPSRPIPSGKIMRSHAVAYTAVLFISGIALTLLLNNMLCLMIAVFNSLLLIGYSYSLQSKVLIGNVAVAYLASSTFLFGGAAVGDITLPLLLMLLSGLATFSREVVKDLEDLEGDRKSFLKKVASKMRESFGERFRVSRSGIKLRYKTIYAVLVACFGIWLAVIASVIPYVWGIFGTFYLIVLVPTDAVFVFSSMVLIRTRSYKRASKMLKIGMLLGLVAFLVGKVF